MTDQTNKPQTSPIPPIYKVGDRVRVMAHNSHHALDKMIGTIRGLDPTWKQQYAVEFDATFPYAHGCHTAEKGTLVDPTRGQWVHEFYLTRVVTPTLNTEVKYQGQWTGQRTQPISAEASARLMAALKHEGIAVENKSTMDFKATNPKDKAATTRVDLSLFPDSALIAGCMGMVEGDCKYGGFNYRIKGVLASTYVSAARRHIIKWWNGQDADPKTRVLHLGSAIASLAILIDAENVGVLKDDRPPAADMQELLDDMEATVAHLQKTFPGGPSRFTELDDWNGAYDGDRISEDSG